MADGGRLTADGVSDAVDLILSARAHVAGPTLLNAARRAWPHVSQGAGEELQTRAAALAELLKISDTTPGFGPSSTSPRTDEEVTRTEGT